MMGKRGILGRTFSSTSSLAAATLFQTVGLLIFICTTTLPRGADALLAATSKLIVTPNVADWARDRYRDQPLRLWDERSDRQFTISDVTCHACQQTLLVSSTTFGGHLPQEIGDAYMEGLNKVKQARRNYPAFRGSPYVENDAQRETCVTYIAGDVTDEFYEGGVRWSTQSASSLGFGTMREVRMGPHGGAGGHQRLNPAILRSALYDCPAVTFGGGNPALFAKNLLHLKTQHTPLWIEMKTLIDQGLLFVFTYSAGAFVTGKSGAHWLVSPDTPHWLIGRDRNEVRDWLDNGTLDLLGSAVVKTHFNDDLDKRFDQREMFRFVREEGDKDMYSLSDGDPRGRRGMDFMQVAGKKATMRTSGKLFASPFGIGAGFYTNATDRLYRAQVVRQEQNALPMRFAPIQLVAQKPVTVTPVLPKPVTPVVLPKPVTPVPTIKTHGPRGTQNNNGQEGGPASSHDPAGKTRVDPGGKTNHQDDGLRSWPVWLIVILAVVPLAVVIAVVIVIALCCSKKSDETSVQHEVVADAHHNETHHLMPGVDDHGSSICYQHHVYAEPGVANGPPGTGQQAVVV